MADFERLLEAVRRHDVVIAQRLPPQLLRYVARMPIRYVADLYNPQMIEVLEAMGDGGGTISAARLEIHAGAVRGGRPRDLRQREAARPVARRDGPGGTDRLRALPRDPTFRSFVDVVPFGLPDRPPQRSEPVLKGVWPGIGRARSGAAVGGRDLALARRAHADPGGRAPARPGACACTSCSWAPAARRSVRTWFPRPPTRRSPSRASAASRASACTSIAAGSPTTSAQAYLLEADLGVCAHHDHLEARFSFRTRVLDHLWAGLPSVVSSGDAIGELVERRGLGRAVAPGRRRRLRLSLRGAARRPPGARRRGRADQRGGAGVPLARGRAAARGVLPGAPPAPAAAPAAGRPGARDLRPVPRHPRRPARARRARVVRRVAATPRVHATGMLAPRRQHAAPPRLSASELVAVVRRGRRALDAPEGGVQERRHALRVGRSGGRRSRAGKS